VEARIRDYHGVDFGDALEAISYLRDAGDSVVAGGSLTLGLGNRLSDLDLVVSGEASQETSRLPLQHWVKTLRVDVWKLRSDWMAELVGRAERVLADEAPVDGAFGDIFEEADLKLLHRVAFGIAVDGPPLQPPATRSYQEIAGDLLVREYAERMREGAFSAQLAQGAQDYIGAAFNARLALQSALHATLYGHGFPFTGDKWLSERLTMDATCLVPLHESFAVLPDSPDDTAEFVRSSVQECSRLSGLDLSLPALAPVANFLVGDLELSIPADERYLVSPSLDALWSLDAHEAETWARLTGGARWSCDPSDQDALRLSYRLYAVGAVKLRWTRGLPVAEMSFNEGVVT
jgi:hypothetical protein